MTSSSRAIHIGTSGWSYDHWKKIYYPEDLKSPKWLNFYSQTFSTVEINNTFYHMPSEAAVKNWYKQVSDEFQFSIKASRYITHVKRLKDCKENVDLLHERLRDLKEKLGPILVQLPPSFKLNKERLVEFISYLKKDQLYVFEFRDPSWFIEDIYKLLRKHNIAFCITDLKEHKSPEIITADFTYLRLHGPLKAYQGSYGKIGIHNWKKKLEKWNDKVAVYCYFDNDEKAFAIKDAKHLLELL